MPYRLPTTHERRALFAYLTRASSLTAWRVVQERHRVFVERVESAFEDTQRHPPPDEHPLIDTYDMRTLFSCQGAFDRAIQRLRDGDRSCFRFLGASGHFNEGMRGILAWVEAVTRFELTGDPDFPPIRSPHWPDIQRAMTDCLLSYRQVSPVLQGRFTDVPAPIESIDEMLAAHNPLFRRLAAADSLPTVPCAEPPVVVRTGQTITVDGIWEPVVLRQLSGRNGLFRRAIASSRDRHDLAGCMNYLHGGSPAPTIGFPEDDLRREGRSTHWRLLWKDDRYGKNGVPEDERACDGLGRMTH